MRKIGIMGGTFNPIHNGHLAMAQKACEQFELEEVWFMPAKNPPHKENSEIASDRHRAEMILLAIREKSYFTLSTLEYERQGITYTADTLEELCRKYPTDYFYFIIGSDSLSYIDKWKEPKKLLSMAHILSAPRFPHSAEEDAEKKLFLEKQYGADIQFIEMEPVRVASQEIRTLLKAGKDIRSYVPEAVDKYIIQHKLYADGGVLHELYKESFIKI